MTLAAKVGCSRGTVKRWENDSDSDVSPEYRQPLADALKVELIGLDAILNGRNETRLSGGWWSNYETLEQSATMIKTWEVAVVPGLLQTRRYAATLLREEHLINRRLDRQKILTREVQPATIHAVIDESALLRPIGGRYVLADQMRHMAEMSKRDNVIIQILPLDNQVQSAGWGSFTVLTFTWLGGLVYLQHRGGSHSLDSEHDVEAHAALFGELTNSALPPEHSIRLMEARAKELAA
jgi:hypothetical protein